jgi:hypothetical protein
MWDLWWEKWHWDRFFFDFFGFSISVLFHRGSMLIYHLRQCGPTCCDSQANLYNAANMSERKQNTKIKAMVRIKK